MPKLIFSIIQLLFVVNLVFGQVPTSYNGFPFILDSLRYREVRPPLVADLDKDGQREIVTATFIDLDTSKLYVIRSDGTNQTGFPKTLKKSVKDIAVGDVNDDGFLDIVLRSNIDIDVVDRFGNSLSGFPVPYFFSNPPGDYVSLYDLDNDGKLEIILTYFEISTRPGGIVVFNFDGSIRAGWPKESYRRYGKHPAIGDIDGDGFAEIITSGFKKLSVPPWGDSGFINIYRHNGTVFSNNWPVYLESPNVSFTGSPTVFVNSANPESTFICLAAADYSLLADLDLSSFDGLYGGETFNSKSHLKQAIEIQQAVKNKLFKFNIFGAIVDVAFQDTPNDGLGSLVMGDLNGDGILEFASGTQYKEYLTVYNNRLQIMQGWPKDGNGAYHFNALIGKLTYGSGLNVLSTNWSAASTTAAGFIFSYDVYGNSLNWSPLRILGLVDCMTITDLNNDGNTEIVISSAQFIKVFIHVVTLPGITFSHENFPWPELAHDRYHTNQYGFVPPDEPIGIKPISNSVPEFFALYQNYPNPFNSETKIRFEVPDAGHANSNSRGLGLRLIVYDVLGREITTLVNEKLEPGVYEVKWNSSNFSSGVYFYRMIIDGSLNYISETKKMVILK